MKYYTIFDTLIVSNTKSLSTITAPGRVTSFEIKRPSVILTTMEVSWSIPLLRERNGIIKEYKIDHNISEVSGIYSEPSLLILVEFQTLNCMTIMCSFLKHHIVSHIHVH